MMGVSTVVDSAGGGDSMVGMRRGGGLEIIGGVMGGFSF